MRSCRSRFLGSPKPNVANHRPDLISTLLLKVPIVRVLLHAPKQNSLMIDEGLYTTRLRGSCRLGPFEEKIGFWVWGLVLGERS